MNVLTRNSMNGLWVDTILLSTLFEMNGIQSLPYTCVYNNRTTTYQLTLSHPEKSLGLTKTEIS